MPVTLLENEIWLRCEAMLCIITTVCPYPLLDLVELLRIRDFTWSGFGDGDPATEYNPNITNKNCNDKYRHADIKKFSQSNASSDNKILGYWQRHIL